MAQSSRERPGHARAALEADENPPYLDATAVLRMLGMFAIGPGSLARRIGLIDLCRQAGAPWAQALRVAAGVTVAF